MQKKATVRMSDLLTMEDFEGLKQSQHNLSSFEILLQVASVATKKYDLAHMNNENIEPNRGTNYVACKGAQRNEGQNLTSYDNKATSKMHKVKTKSDEGLTHDDLIKEGRQEVQKSVKNKSSRKKIDTLKRKLEETISNEEWIEAIEMKRKKKKNRRRGNQNPPTQLASLSKEFERKIIHEYGGTRITRVIQKYLTETDVSKGHCRVTIPCSQVESFNFLDGEEMTNLRLGRSITVPFIHTLTENGMSLPLSETSLQFRQWDFHRDKNDLQKASYQYVLKTNWNTIVEIDDLRKKDHVQIWAFRDVRNKLCMALVKL
ncbi:hypothetical protein K1719_030878 [Acacia pycnantha]|nr:hypothetical protein K1719_030878 [Acacia pycnantha]